MDVERYREFIVLAEELNMHRAAQRLCLAQSTLSKHVAALERHYGVQLIDRSGARLALTNRGAALLESAQEIWGAYERSVELVTPGGREPSSLYLSGILDNPAEYPVVSKALERFKALGHRSTPHFLPCTSADIEAQANLLRTGEAACAVMNMTPDMLAALPDADAFGFQVVCRVPLDAVMSRDNPLASKRRIAAEDLFGTTLVQLVGPRLSPSWRQIEAQLRTAHVVFHTKPIAASSLYDYAMMEPGDSVLLTSRESALAPAIMHPNAVRVPVDEGLASLDLCALYRADAMTGALQGFIDALAACYAEAYPAK